MTHVFIHKHRVNAVLYEVLKLYLNWLGASTNIFYCKLAELNCYGEVCKAENN